MESMPYGIEVSFQYSSRSCVVKMAKKTEFLKQRKAITLMN